MERACAGAFGAEYAQDVLATLLERETTHTPGASAHQPNWETRRALVAQLAQLHTALALAHETLFLAVAFLDAYCARQATNPHATEYYLLGVVCLWVAAKCEENYGECPPLRRLVALHAAAYPPERFRALEHALLRALRFDMCPPTPLAFLQVFSVVDKSEVVGVHRRDAADLSARAFFLACYIAELATLSPYYLFFRPSVVARAAIELADVVLLSMPPTNCVDFLYTLLLNPDPAMRAKYQADCFLGVSYAVDTWISCGFHRIFHTPLHPSESSSCSTIASHDYLGSFEQPQPFQTHSHQLGTAKKQPQNGLVTPPSEPLPSSGGMYSTVNPLAVVSSSDYAPWTIPHQRP